ncbi:MAG: GGDEF domain-containing protein [Planctomycetales bacterium]|nr:GGDEF domain-containing protein [Planctomycetales bacterium]
MLHASLATLTLPAHDTHRNGGGAHWLVQIFPLELDRGPIPLDSDAVVIGRDAKCDVAFDDPSISRVHATVRQENDGYVVEDLASTNGVFVNDRRVDAQAVVSGDRIRLGQRIFRFLTADDIEAQYYETVYGMMTRDGLTGAFNRRYLMEALHREVSRGCRYDRPLSVALLDVDHFKGINDKWGHLVGDEVLCELTRRLNTLADDDAFLARYGGEEFALVLVETELEEATTLAERLRSAIADAPFATTAGDLSVTISVGVAALGPSDCQVLTADDLLAEADFRLNDAKKSGRNRVVATAVS